jgi:L-serine dehydratase
MIADAAPGTERLDSARAISVAELFTIGVGPSSSHTVGPMRAAFDFASRAIEKGAVERVRCELFGSLALTGLGHSTDIAILLGLAGEAPEAVDPDTMGEKIAAIRSGGRLRLAGTLDITFDEPQDLIFLRGEFLAGHANAMRFTASYADGRVEQATYFSIGGGAILREGEAPPRVNFRLAHPFSSAAELLAAGEGAGLRSRRSSLPTNLPGDPRPKPRPFWTMCAGR